MILGFHRASLAQRDVAFLQVIVNRQITPRASSYLTYGVSNL
ncbi:uncharacterized protein MP3633_3257 [Marinomonas primoryensis]|uniref:Uncharacterized protein n=1 Tax=Marinomonas primoryensis TaxID=178399 RepID=A0A859CZM9_9GAMM|nr:uncharacterized protein MP3633_3257 [Marinomonas primoryensis]